jgi:hypothetical protein
MFCYNLIIIHPELYTKITSQGLGTRHSRLHKWRGGKWPKENAGFMKIKIIPRAGSRWLTAIILATQEAEIKKMEIQSQPQENSLQDPISKIPNTKKRAG